MNRAFPLWLATTPGPTDRAAERLRAAHARNVERWEAYVGARLALPASRWSEALVRLSRMTDDDWRALAEQAPAHLAAGRAPSSLLFPAASVSSDDDDDRDDRDVPLPFAPAPARASE